MKERSGNNLSPLPERIQGLSELANNLWWSWNREARALFREIDTLTWRRTRHNAIEVLHRADPARLAECASNRSFLDRYDRALAALHHAVDRGPTWFHHHHAQLSSHTIAYFCAEFGLHNSVPIYSGGLGILAGDHCKTASDLGVPLVGVGLLYTRGYFDQRVGPDGWQQDADEVLDLTITPLARVLNASGEPLTVSVRACDRDLHIGAWRLSVGSVPIFLLETDLEQNHAEDRGLTHRLYAGGSDLRLRQEWLLGVGGVRILRALDIHPAAWHANEGHSSFMLVERLREAIVSGLAWDDATKSVRETSVFTTHTPVEAGHDEFGHGELTACVGPIWEELGVDREQFLDLGRHPENRDVFHMTATAIRLSASVNGVSRLHGQVTRRMWQALWPDRDEAQIPIGHVTNGVHLATWMAIEVMSVLDEVMGDGWDARRDDPDLWDRVLDVDPAKLWGVHCRLKHRLIDYVREEARQRWRTQWPESARVVGAGVLLNPDAFTIGFARRFATYKRADLVFSDAERLRRLLTNPRRPVQIIFAGKAHPADEAGKQMIQDVYGFASDPAFEGRVTFLEDYEMHLAHRLVQGVDLWLNLPRPPLEACGTSGMKAALNGAPQLGTVDGWWAEGFTGENGWAIPQVPEDHESPDQHDADHLYGLLESEIVPLFYERGDDDVPTQWVRRMQHAIAEAGRNFTSRQMMQRYVHHYYVPCMQAATNRTKRGRPSPEPVRSRSS